MPLTACICAGDGQVRPFRDCIRHHAYGTGPAKYCHQPVEVLVAMDANNDERKDAGISATTILDCQRAVVLKSTHDFAESPESYYARFRGTMGHLMMEAYPPDAYIDDDLIILRERRLKKAIEVDGVEMEITGKFDCCYISRNILIDYKTTDRVPSKLKDGHEAQLNIYTWLLRGGRFVDEPKLATDQFQQGETLDVPIVSMGIQYMSMKSTRKIGAPIWDLDVTETFLRERLRPLVQYQREGQLPAPSVRDQKSTAWKCRFCPVRDVCESLMSPQERNRYGVTASEQQYDDE